MQRQGPSWSLLDGQVGSRPVSQAKEDGNIYRGECGKWDSSILGYFSLARPSGELLVKLPVQSFWPNTISKNSPMWCPSWRLSHRLHSPRL